METKKKGGLTALWLIVAVIAVLIGSTFSLIRNNLNLGLDLQGGFEILYEIAPLNEGQSLDMTAVINSIQKRVDVLGVNEPQITVEGTDRVRVQLAGVADQETARSMLGTTANLTFRDVDDNLLADSSIIQEGGASRSLGESLRRRLCEGETLKCMSQKTCCIRHVNRIEFYAYFACRLCK